MRLCVDFVIAVEKYVHGTKATYEKIGYGIPSLETLANPPNTTENTIIENTGLIIAQANPKIVCL